MNEAAHQWRFFRAGGFEQPLLNKASDLAALSQLDQKLWATLACPAERLSLDAKFLALLDDNNDQRIRAPEVLAAVEWSLARLSDPECLFSQRPLCVADFKPCDENHNLILAARRLLELLGRGPEDSLCAADTADPQVIFPPEHANGDGLVPPQLTTDEALKALIQDIIDCLGAEIDRSQEEAISAGKLNQFFTQVQAVKDWYHSADEPSRYPFQERTDCVIALLQRLQDKINDHFTRLELVSYDSRAAVIMAADEQELIRLAAGNLAEVDNLRNLPLANLQQQNGLALHQGINPAWRDDIQALYETAIVPLWGEVDQLTLKQWQELLQQAQGYFDWQAQKPANQILESLGLEKVLALDSETRQAQLQALIDKDLLVAEAAQGWMDLDRLLNMQQHLVPLLKNFVSFEDFYSRHSKAIFQAGRLYIDGKSCDMVVEVEDVNAHSALASQSNCFLIYCHCTRRGQPIKGREERHIVALISAGVDHELMVGRNGLFYDRDGNDWDATVVKVIESAISVRQAFWSPYRRAANMISEQIQKFASDKDSQQLAGTDAALKNGTPALPFDIAKFAGIFAAMGLAIGAIGTFFAAAFAGLLSLPWSQWPLVFIGLVVVISGPAMLLAWFKLRRRSLGPILDANGWAVNTQARISIPFGTSLTQIASLPRGSARSVKDPYARKNTLSWLLPVLLVVAAIAAWYYLQP